MNSRLDLTGVVLTSSGDALPAEELFAAANTAVIVALVSTGRVVALNPAAQRQLGIARSELLGHDWREAFDDACEQPLGSAAREAVASGNVVRATVPGSAGDAAMAVVLSTFCVAKISYLLVRLVADDAAQAPPRTVSSDVLDALDDLAVGFVVTDGALCIEFANRAFLDFVNQPCHADVEHQSLLRWLNLAQADLLKMNRQMAMREAATAITARLWVGPTTAQMVEITAIAVPDAASPRWGFVVQKAVQH
jgi:PAS domain-containing protein